MTSSYENSKIALELVNLHESLSANQIVNTTDGFTLFDLYKFADTMDVEATSTINNKTAKYLIGVAKIVGNTNYLPDLDVDDPDRRFYIGYDKLQEYLEDVTKAMLIALLEGNAKRTTNLSSDTLQEKRQIFLNALKKEKYKDQTIKPWSNWREIHSTKNIIGISRTNNIVTVTVSNAHELATEYDDWGALITINNSDFDITNVDYPNGIPIEIVDVNTFTYKKEGPDTSYMTFNDASFQAQFTIGWGGPSNNLHIHFNQ